MLLLISLIHLDYIPTCQYFHKKKQQSQSIIATVVHKKKLSWCFIMPRGDINVQKN